MRVSVSRILFLGFFVMVIASNSQTEAQHERKNSWEPAYSLLDRLVRAPKQISVHQFSSHNKRGLNGDENWPLYVDEYGDDVIFDASGPGCVRSMWGTNFDPDSLLKFYFDGEENPRYTIKYTDFYRGEHPHFPRPLVSYEKRGMWGDRPYAGNSFIPIPFEKWLKISVQGKSRFFHIIYEKYPFKTRVESFSGREDREALEHSFQRLGESPLSVEGLRLFESETEIVEPGQPLSLLKLEKESGIIRKIEIEADGSPEFFQDTLLRMRWDGHTHWDVHTRSGIFFGSAVKADEMRSLPLRVEIIENGRVRLSCWFPMPFWEGAEVEWINRSQHRLAPLKTRVFVEKTPISPQEGLYFTALYREGETTYGRDWLLYEGPGTGWYVGTVQSMRNAHYCEGDEHFYLDGVISPQINGTGSEDYYLACFWPNVDFDTPFGGVVGDITAQGGGDMVGAYYIPSCYSRYHLEAPIPFYDSINARIQHGGLSHILSDYRSLSFCYLRRDSMLNQTDYLDVGSPTSEKAHTYGATQSGPVKRLEAQPEGEYFENTQSETGRYHSGGAVSFRVAVDPENGGVRLRRRIDQAELGQKAEVYINGQYAGTWYHGCLNPHLRWYDSDFDIHPDLTRGKTQLDVKLSLVQDKNVGAFTDFSYTVYCFAD
jgi:hypothetical protein